MTWTRELAHDDDDLEFDANWTRRYFQGDGLVYAWSRGGKNLRVKTLWPVDLYMPGYSARVASMTWRAPIREGNYDAPWIRRYFNNYHDNTCWDWIGLGVIMCYATDLKTSWKRP